MNDIFLYDHWGVCVYRVRAFTVKEALDHAITDGVNCHSVSSAKVIDPFRGISTSAAISFWDEESDKEKLLRVLREEGYAV